MQEKPKQSAYNYLIFLEHSFLAKVSAGFLLFLFFYVYLPIYLKYHFQTSFWPLFVFHLFNILAVGIVLKGALNKKYKFNYEISSLQERINIASDQNSHLLKESTALQAKIIRYSSLKKVVEEINEDFNLDSVTNHLVSIAFSLISNNKGSCILYLVDSSTQRLSLFKTKKEDKRLVVKTKEGDLLDYWVLRHASPLLVEDIKKDFRFDTDKLFADDSRVISSVVSSPLISDHRFLGILRLDHPEPGFYSQDDLRFLLTMCDLGAVALENSEYFRETQDLAIHDELTSLYTKGYFLESLKEECRRAYHHKKVFSLLLLDIDYFKDYNDKFGHIAGDIVLKTLSAVILESLKEYSPIVSRFGGEEFCVILPGMAKKEAVLLANSVRERVEVKKMLLRRQETTITVSIGVASFPGDGDDECSLIEKADKAMYAAKQQGRNKVCFI